jgi:D-amino peptidase
VSGDQVTIEETAAVIPDIVGVVVKRAITRFSATSLHPERACAAIRAGATEAVEAAASGLLRPPPIELPARLEVDWLTADMAEMAGWVGGVQRTSGRSVEITDIDPLAVFRRFVAAVAITRAIVEA